MKLKRVGTQYLLVKDGITIEGPWHTVERYMVDSLGIDLAELVQAKLDFQRTGNDTAIFGINGTFIRTCKESVSRNVHEELLAIQALRLEFTEKYKACPSSLDTRDTYNRLMTLYMSLNVNGILELLENDEEYFAA